MVTPIIFTQLKIDINAYMQLISVIYQIKIYSKSNGRVKLILIKNRLTISTRSCVIFKKIIDMFIGYSEKYMR